MDELASCPHCGSYAVVPTTKADKETGLCEYRCEDCGEYFVDLAPLPDTPPGEPAKRELMSIEKYNIFRVTTRQVRNNWNEVIFEPGQVLQAVMDLGWCWLARPVGSAAAPRRLPKAECRELNEAERARMDLIDPRGEPDSIV